VAKIHTEKSQSDAQQTKLRKDIQKYREEIDELSEFKIQKAFYK
jgi:hypothetical protein